MSVSGSSLTPFKSTLWLTSIAPFGREPAAGRACAFGQFRAAWLACTATTVVLPSAIRAARATAFVTRSGRGDRQGALWPSGSTLTWSIAASAWVASAMRRGG